MDVELVANAGAQDEFLRTEARYPALIGGQGSGKTWGGSARIVLDHVRYPGSNSLGVEPTFSLLRQVMLPAICEQLDRCHIDYDTNLSAMEIKTPELGSKFILHSGAAAQTLTAFEVGRAWIDEPARIPEYDDPKRNIWIACVGRVRCPNVPVEGRRIMITGTHEGKGTWVYNRWETDRKPGYEVHRARTGDNPSSREQEALYIQEYGPELAAQYVYGFAVEDSMAAVPYAVLEALQDGRARENDVAALAAIPGPMYVGVDIGRTQSLTVFWVVRVEKETQLVTEAVIVLRNAPFMEQLETLSTLARLPQIQRITIDATYNPQTAEDACRAFGDLIEPIMFTPITKREIYQSWINACQMGRLRLPCSEDILMDLFSVKRVVSSLGVVSYQAPFTADGHADRACAAALAVWASRGGPAVVTYEAGPEVRGRQMTGI